MVTSKQDFENHGIGLRSVQDLVKQQGGEINIYTEHDIFHVEVMMTII
ncbi:MAG: GHKL domain-containing protein [Acetatifactor sp.]